MKTAFQIEQMHLQNKSLTKRVETLFSENARLTQELATLRAELTGAKDEIDKHIRIYKGWGAEGAVEALVSARMSMFGGALHLKTGVISDVSLADSSAQEEGQP